MPRSGTKVGEWTCSFTLRTPRRDREMVLFSASGCVKLDRQLGRFSKLLIPRRKLAPLAERDGSLIAPPCPSHAHVSVLPGSIKDVGRTDY